MPNRYDHEPVLCDLIPEDQLRSGYPYFPKIVSTELSARLRIGGKKILNKGQHPHTQALSRNGCVLIPNVMKLALQSLHGLRGKDNFHPRRAAASRRRAASSKLMTSPPATCDSPRSIDASASGGAVSKYGAEAIDFANKTTASTCSSDNASATAFSFSNFVMLYPIKFVLPVQQNLALWEGSLTISRSADKWVPGTVFVAPLPLKLLELHPVGFDGVIAKAALFVFFVGFEVAFEPFDVAVAFEGENVGRKPV
jgi:hypothetical protein